MGMGEMCKRPSDYSTGERSFYVNYTVKPMTRVPEQLGLENYVFPTSTGERQIELKHGGF